MDNTVVFPDFSAWIWGIRFLTVYRNHKSPKGVMEAWSAAAAARGNYAIREKDANTAFFLAQAEKRRKAGKKGRR